MVCVPLLSEAVVKDASVLSTPLIFELHSHPVTVPSLSMPCPVNCTAAPDSAGLGVMESITAVGTALISSNCTASAQVLGGLLVGTAVSVTL